MNCTELSAKDRVEIELSQLDEKITKLDNNGNINFNVFDIQL